MLYFRLPSLVGCCLLMLLASSTLRGDTREKLKAYLDAVPAISTHDHLRVFDQLQGFVETDRGRGMTLHSIWQNSYYPWVHPLSPWKPGSKFDDWWAKAKGDFRDARAASFYRYMLIAFQDLYGVDFDRISDEDARVLNDRIFKNYLDQRWLYEVITEKANIEVLVNDRFWSRFDFRRHYPFEAMTLNVTTLVKGFHPSEFAEPLDSPYEFAKKHGMKLETLDDFLKVLDKLFEEAKKNGAVCLKTTLAYLRSLFFANVPRARAEKAFGRRRSDLAAEEIRDFEDYVMWRLTELSAKHGLPFQIHTGHARIQGSNPMNLVELIEANPKTKFILFHGGYPWVGETGAMVTRHGRHVWIDSTWLPTISQTMARRAYHEWLDVMPSNRILWGADSPHPEGIYAATQITRRVLAEVLAERVDKGDLKEDHARRIGKQILRDNALELFPALKERLWKGKEKKLMP